MPSNMSSGIRLSMCSIYGIMPCRRKQERLDVDSSSTDFSSLGGGGGGIKISLHNTKVGKVLHVQRILGFVTLVDST